MQQVDEIERGALDRGTLDQAQDEWVAEIHKLSAGKRGQVMRNGKNRLRLQQRTVASAPDPSSWSPTHPAERVQTNWLADVRAKVAGGIIVHSADPSRGPPRIERSRLIVRTKSRRRGAPAPASYRPKIRKAKMNPALSSEPLDQISATARTYNGWSDTTVDRAPSARTIYDLEMGADLGQ